MTIFISTLVIGQTDKPMLTVDPFMVTTYPINLPTENDPSIVTNDLSLVVEDFNCNDCRTTFAVILPIIEHEDFYPMIVNINQTGCDDCVTNLIVNTSGTDAQKNELQNFTLVNSKGTDCEYCNTTFTVTLPQHNDKLHIVADISDNEYDRNSKVLTLEVFNKTTSHKSQIPSINITASPNPIRSIANLEYVLEETAMVQLYLYNAQGKLVKELITNQQHEAGVYNLQMLANDLEEGTYFLTLETEYNTDYQKVILIK